MLMAGCAAPGSTPEVNRTSAVSKSRICAKAARFATMDRVTAEQALHSYDSQVRAQDNWRSALTALGGEMPPGETRNATETLRDASTTVDDDPWTKQQESAYAMLDSYLKNLCQVDLRDH